MKNSTPIIITIATILLAGIVSLTWWNARNRDVAHVEPVPAEGEVAQTAPAPIQAPGVRAPRTAGRYDSRALRETREAQRKAASQVVEAGRQKLTRQYQMERVDGQWALAKERTLERLSTSPQIDEIGAQPAAMTVQCRTTVCHVVADFPNNRAADDWFALYPMNVGMEMPNISQQRTTNPDGTVRVELYGLARPAKQR